MITATKADCIYKFECPKIELCFKHCHFIYTKCNYLKSKKNALKTNRYMFCYYCWDQILRSIDILVPISWWHTCDDNSRSNMDLKRYNINAIIRNKYSYTVAVNIEKYKMRNFSRFCVYLWKSFTGNRFFGLSIIDSNWHWLFRKEFPCVKYGSRWCVNSKYRLTRKADCMKLIL